MLAQAAVALALAYLEGEVARWKPDNGCFSCHNNGDAARALHKAGRPVDAATREWLLSPGKWDSNPGDPAVSDKRLARIQFANALLTTPGATRDQICQAAALVARDQGPGGEWAIDNTNSPATYGTALATYFASRIVRPCNPEAFSRAARYLDSFQPKSVTEAAAKLLHDPGNRAAREFLVKSQTSDGAWGEHPNSPAEVFDTAIVVIALKQARFGDTAKPSQWLLSRQQPGGGWPETTRPAGSQSYAQHISTTAWAVLSLLDEGGR